MAYTVTRTKTVFGNLRAVIMNVTADAAESNIETGLSRIIGVSIAKISMNSSNQHFAINSNSSGLAAMGIFGVSGCTSGDNLNVIVYGV